MGMCAIRGPRVLHEEVEASEVSSPRSCTTTGYGSASSQELDHIAAEVRQFYHDGAIWQRTIPRGRRCKPLSFSGMILYDQNGNLLAFPNQLEEDEEVDEYFSPRPKTFAEREEESRS